MVPQRQQIRLMAKKVFLEFEKELGDINARIEALENEEIETGKSDRAAMMQLQREMTAATARIYEKLTPWQTALVARHPNRPYTMDYIEACIDDFQNCTATVSSHTMSPSSGDSAASGNTPSW